jgi:hypothetical protein
MRRRVVRAPRALVHGWSTLVALGSLLPAVTGPAVAQPSAVTVRGVVEGDVVEGRITRVDRQTRTITLDNGQDYVIPQALALDWELAQPDTPVMVRYSVDAGRNIATALDFRP